MRKISFLVVYIIFWIFFSVGAQYYYFDSETSTFPYQQWCVENLQVKINTQWEKPTAWLLRLLFDPINILYSNSNLASELQSDLFVASTETFSNWTSPTQSPSWIDEDKTILQLDRNNWTVWYDGSWWLYWTIKFIPNYNQNFYTWVFAIIYDSSTIKTSLSVWWVNTINPIFQNPRLTWSYNILQQPCVDDEQFPNISLTTPINSAIKQTYLSWISLSLTDVGGSSADVPYVWTWWNLRTGNNWSIDTQYGIDISTLQITLSGNGQTRIFTSWTYAAPSAKTWQFLDKNYSVLIPSWALFDYGIEKRIDLSVQIRDRKWLQRNISYSFNHPKGPELIAGTRFPVVNALFVNYDTPIRFGVQDDWAGVNSGSIVVTLSGINGTSYGPYVFSGNMLSFSGLSSNALQPNWIVEVSNHVDFPASWTIRVSVAVRDMAENQWTISDYSFVTRQSCSQLWCCDDKYIQYKNISSLFTRNTVIVEGGLDPVFYLWSGGVWYLDCGLINQGMSIYRWSESESGSAQLIDFLDVSNLRIMGNNVKAVFSWSTLVLQKIFDYWSLDWWGWWGWIRFEKDNCPDWDNSYSYYDGICDWDFHGSANSCPVENNDYPQELIDAFQFAYGFGITTMCPIEKADIRWNLLRKHLAKMITEYAVTIVWLYPDITKEWCDEYNDIEDQSSEMKFYSKIICQLWLMGLESDWIVPQKSFRPNDIVTRAQFWTILSRLIFGDAYNVSWNNSDLYYIKHLQALNDNWIMKMIEYPEMPEVRGWVMLMLQRTYETWIIDRYRMLHNANNTIRVIYDF